MTTPLEDPTYQPANPPIGDEVPDVVAKWGPASQVRWFERYRGQLKRQPWDYWQRFHTGSIYHKGGCCVSCEQDGECIEDSCCCYGLR